jgi:diaminopropionate ammonia-lyase
MTTLPAGQERLPPPEVVLNDGALDRVPGASRRTEALDVHRRLPGYAPSPLLPCPRIATRLGLGEVWVKDESWRLGLPSFKMLGASYAICRALADRLGHDLSWQSVDELRAALADLGPLRLAAATDGNHGRAVARMAKLLGYGAAIYVPEGTTPARIDAIESEGARVTVVPGDYDEAVRRSAQDESDRCLVVSDTSWPGYEQIPTRVIEGYATIFAEVSQQLVDAGAGEPTAVLVPMGVGALAAATVDYYKPGEATGSAPKLVGVEPASANCVMASIRAGHLVTVPGPHRSIMVGLNCGTPSRVAWPLVSRGIDAVASIDDGWARRAMCELAEVGVVAGETGAASLAGLSALVESEQETKWREALQLDNTARVLVLSTEGATDPQAWSRIVGRPVPAVRQAT